MGNARQGQMSLEIAVLAAVIVAALLAMQIYMKRSVAGRLRKAADEIGEQYAPRQTGSGLRTTSTSTTRTVSHLVDSADDVNYMDTETTIGVGGNPEQVSRTGWESVGPYKNSIWDR